MSRPNNKELSNVGGGIMSLTNSQIITPYAPCYKTVGRHRRIKASLSLHGFIVQAVSIDNKILRLGIRPENTPHIEATS